MTTDPKQVEHDMPTDPDKLMLSNRIDQENRERVVIAQAVLAALAERRMIATTGVYVSAPGFAALPKDMQLQDYFSYTPCAVCGVGALFVACVNRFNDFTVGEAGNDGASTRLYFKDYLERWFSHSQLLLIEIAFEGSTLNAELAARPPEESDAAVKFYNEHKDPTSRLRDIMHNIIDNHGEFQP